MPTLTHTNTKTIIYVPYEKQQYTNKKQKIIMLLPTLIMRYYDVISQKETDKETL